MRPLSDKRPKPMLEVGGKPLVLWLLEALHRSGCHQAVINTAWLGEQFVAYLGEPQPTLAGLQIHYSHEGQDFGQALETAGGIARALPQLGKAFWVSAGDVYAPQFSFDRQAEARFLAGEQLAHLWLVPNPTQHPHGDFGLAEDGLLCNEAPLRLTYSTIGLYRAEFFSSLPFGNPQGLVRPLAPMLRAAIDNRQVTGELYHGAWTDVGTAERLAQLNSSSPIHHEP